MKCEAFVFFVIPLLAKAFHAWLQDDPYRVENGFITYGGFHPSFYHSLTATQIAITLSEDILDCGFACMDKPKCASFNVAAKPDSSGSSLCELLETGMYYDSGKLQGNASFHHYSPRTVIAAKHVMQDLLEINVNGKNTTAGHLCSLPFKYKGVTYNSCTKKDGQSYWCSLDPVYRGRSETCACTPKTTAGNFCSIPFTYKGVTYHSCTKDNSNRYWCSLDTIYQRRWEHCGNVVNADSREDTDILAINFIKEELGVDLKREDIGRSYRVGKRSTKPRPIIVHLSRQNTKVEIFQKRRVLKQDIKH
ncbi:Seminal plasma protein BSP-30 kDa, partial [Acropora cervicornis]